MKKLLEYLDWSLSMIDSNFKETGKMTMAEAFVWKQAKAYCEKIKIENESIKQLIEECETSTNYFEVSKQLLNKLRQLTM